MRAGRWPPARLDAAGRDDHAHQRSQRARQQPIGAHGDLRAIVRGRLETHDELPRGDARWVMAGHRDPGRAEPAVAGREEEFVGLLAAEPAFARRGWVFV